MKHLISLVLLAVFLAACGASAAPAPLPPTAVLPAPATNTAAAPAATDAPVLATAAPKPTDAPKATAAPTNPSPQTGAPTAAAAELPAGWTVQQTDRFSLALPANYAVSATDPFTAIDSATFATISVMALPTISGKSQTIVDTAAKMLTPGAKVIKSQAGLTINGKEAGLFEYDMVLGSGSSETHSVIVNYYFLSGSDEFDLSISGGNPNDPNFVPTAEKIGNSFTVEK